MIRKIHLYLSDNTALYAALTETLCLQGFDLIPDPLNADCIVASSASKSFGIGDKTALLQLTDCGAVASANGAIVANASPILARHAADWCIEHLNYAISEKDNLQTANIHAGIIGLGILGSAIAERLKGIAKDICIADVRTPRQQLMSELGVRRYSLDMLLSKSNVVFVAAHHGPTADPLLSPREFRLMPIGTVLINPSGKKLMDQAALAEASEADAISYVAQRDDTDHTLDCENHAAEVAEHVLDNLQRLNRGEHVKGVVETVDFPLAGDPAFWSSRMSPNQTNS